MVKVVTAECRIAARCQNLEDALGEPQDGDVKGAAAKIIDGINSLGTVIQPVGNRCRRWLVEEAQNIDAGKPCGILGGLSLGIIEIGRNGNDGSHQRATKSRFGAVAQDAENVGRHFHRALDAGHGTQLDHAGGIDKIVGHRFDMGDIATTPPHEALHGNDGVLWILRLAGLRLVTDFGATICRVMHHGRQKRAPELVAQHHRDAAAHRCHQRVCRSEVNTNRQFVLVRSCRLAGFCNLDKRHLVFGESLLFFKRDDCIVDLELQFFEKHQATNAIARHLEITGIIKQLRQFVIRAAHLLAKTMVQVLQLVVVARRARFGHTFTPFHLLHQELDRHRRIVFGTNIVADQMKQISGSRQRFLQSQIGFIGLGCPLQRAPPLGITRLCKSIRMHFGLQFSVTRIQQYRIEAESAGKSEERKVVSVEVHRPRFYQAQRAIRTLLRIGEGDARRERADSANSTASASNEAPPSIKH